MRKEVPQVPVTKITTDLKTGNQERRDMTLPPDVWKRIEKNPPLEANVRYELRSMPKNPNVQELANTNVSTKTAKSLVDDNAGKGVKDIRTKNLGNAKNATLAKAHIDTLKTAEDIQLSIDGEERKGVLSYAEEKIEAIINNANA